MIQDPGLSFLTDWRNFYMLIGTAAATLTGLMFVTTTLLEGMNRHIATMNAGISAFSTPTVVHFCVVLLMCAILIAPWQTMLSVSLLLRLLGLGGVTYMIIVARLMKHIPDRKTPPRDWFWYMAFPLIIYLALIVSAVVLSANPGLVFYFISAATVILLFIGIHNAWDLVTYLVIERSHSERKK